MSVAATCFLTLGCRQDMHDQPRYKTLGYSKFFLDGRDSRPIPANAVARGELNEDAAFYQGKAGGADIDYFPIPVYCRLNRARACPFRYLLFPLSRARREWTRHDRTSRIKAAAFVSY